MPKRLKAVMEESLSDRLPIDVLPVSNEEFIPPEPGVGPVTFYLAGNVVNGNCRPDQGDLWSVASGYVVAQAGP